MHAHCSWTKLLRGTVCKNLQNVYEVVQGVFALSNELYTTRKLIFSLERKCIFYIFLPNGFHGNQQNVDQGWVPTFFIKINFGHLENSQHFILPYKDMVGTISITTTGQLSICFRKCLAIEMTYLVLLHHVTGAPPSGSVLLFVKSGKTCQVQWKFMQHFRKTQNSH